MTFSEPEPATVPPTLKEKPDIIAIKPRRLRATFIPAQWEISCPKCKKRLRSFTSSDHVKALLKQHDFSAHSKEKQGEDKK